MSKSGQILNLTLGGGGVKGIAYSGVFEAAERYGIKWANISGVSAGALAGAFLAAGYNSDQIKKITGEFDFGKIEYGRIPEKLPIVSRYMQYRKSSRNNAIHSVEQYLNLRFREGTEDGFQGNSDFSVYRGNLLKNVLTFSKEGALFNGDYLEEWVYKVLMDRGVKTFADLKTGIRDKTNPSGYKVRMTAVDISRNKVIILPDDIGFYGIEPDRLEVAKAVRMSTSVPFAFFPVELKKSEGNSSKAHLIVDGGVFDGFPFWLIEDRLNPPTAGFKLSGGKKHSIISIETPLNIFKSLVSAVHDIGVPKNLYYRGYLAKINTAKVDFLDFSLNDEQKRYLYDSGKSSARFLFSKISKDLQKPGRKLWVIKT